MHGKLAAAVAAIIAFVLVSCGGGGGGPGGDAEGEDTAPTVVGLETPLGLQGTRGVGPTVRFVYHLRDREFDAADLLVQYGVDHDGDGEIRDDEFLPATPGPGGDGTTELLASPGQGSLHLFEWNCVADLPADRRMTVDYVYTDTGRVALDENGMPVIEESPGVLVRMRPVAPGHVGAWSYSGRFDVNNNHPPAVSVAGVRIPPEGEDDGTVNEEVLVNILTRDPDGDPVALAVDWVSVPADLDPAALTAEELAALDWTPATTGSGGDGTADLASSPEGTEHEYGWDSIADAGTARLATLLRFRAVDGKGELSEWSYLDTVASLDNFTVFNDPDCRLGRGVAGTTAVRLSDGTVLVCGGRGVNGPVADAWLLSTGLSQTTVGEIAPLAGGMNVARAGHTATRLSDGLVLLAGGFGADGAVLDSAEVYDPETREFSLLDSKLAGGRGGHTAVLLLDGRVLLAGGSDDAPLATSEFFDPDDAVFASGPALVNGARAGAAGLRLPDGRVLLAGGEDHDGPLATIELFDPAAGIFVVTDSDSDLPEAARGLALTPTLDPVFAAVATGGEGDEVLAGISRFDATMDTWSASSVDLRCPRADHAAVMLGDGSLLLAGGRTDAAGTPAPTADLYDVANDTVTVPNGEPLVAAVAVAAVVLPNGRAALFGGDAAGTPTDRIQIFTPESGFNLAPDAQIRTPSALEPWAFGVRVYWRAVDPEKDPVRIQPEYMVKASETDDSGALPAEKLGIWRPASMKVRTVLGETSSGLGALSSRAEAVDPADDPIDAPDVDEGEHLFVWNAAKDLPRGDYDNVYFRVTTFGATEGGAASTFRFSVTRNAPAIVRIGAPANDFGAIAVPFWLQDSDAGDLADVSWEYGIDGNGDGRIVDADGEAWSELTHSSESVIVDGVDVTDVGATDLPSGSEDPDPRNEYTDDGGIPWGKKHWLVWDSVYDLGAPAAPRTDVVLRARPRDFDPADPTVKMDGIAGTKEGFRIDRDPDALAFVSFAPAAAGADPAGVYSFAGVRLDESIRLTFSDRVEPSSLSTGSIRIVDEASGIRVAGFFDVDNSGSQGIVTFYPQAPELPVRSDVLAADHGYRIEVPGFDPAAPGAAVVQRLGAAAGDTNARFVLSDETRDRAFRTGSGFTADATAPAFSALSGPGTPTGVDPDSPIAVVFDDRILPSTVDGGTFRVIAKAFAGTESVVPGTFALVNRVDRSGPGGTLRRYAELVFTPTFPLPVGAVPIEVRIDTGLTDLAGNALSAAATVSFTTAAATGTLEDGLTEEFDDTTRRDEDLTTAFWGAADPKDKGSASGSGVTGKLTGGYDVGDGSDGTLDFSAGDVTIDTDTQDVWQLTELVVPLGRSLVVKGSKALDLKVQGDIRIYGTIDASGRDGANLVFYDVFLDESLRTGFGAAGGRGGPGGGAGGGAGKYTWKQSSAVASGDGQPGVGAKANSVGGGGTCGIYSSSQSNYYGAGGGGAAHADDGEVGGLGYYSYTHTPGAAGKRFGSADLTDGVEGGSGGGAGGGVVVDRASGSSERWGYVSGGGGGGGGGAVRITSGGRLELLGTGEIYARGGDGGNTIGYVIDSDLFYKSGTTISAYSLNPGGGGGGSGGSVQLRGGGGLVVHGAIDVRGGTGGIGYDYYYKSGSQQRADTVGGGGADGRIRLEGPTTPDLSKALSLTGSVGIATEASIDGGTAETDWKVTSDTTVNVGTGVGAPSGTYQAGRFLVHDFEVATGATLRLIGDGPFLLHASGEVRVDGRIDATGADGADANQTGYYSSKSGYRPHRSVSGGDGGPGGGDGGDNGFATSYESKPRGGQDGQGRDGSPGGAGAGEGGEPGIPFSYTSGTSTYYHYYLSGSGGGGAGVRPGAPGRVLMRYTSKGRAGIPGGGGVGMNSLLGAGESDLTGGAGGGAGSNGGYQNSSGTKYGYGDGAGGGGGGGAIRIVASGRIRLDGVIDVSGGDGGDATANSSTRAVHPGAGGGGGGGNVVLLAGGGFLLGEGRIHAAGGAGGRAHYDYESSSYDYGDNVYSRGGDGGRGGILLVSETDLDLLNDGNLLAGDGSITTGRFFHTNTAVSTWQDAGAVAPEYTEASFTGTAVAGIEVMGAQTDPMTGEPDLDSATAWRPASQVGEISGCRWFRFRVVLTGSTQAGTWPEVDRVDVTWKVLK